MSNNSDFEFLTKIELIGRFRSENIVITSDVENRLKDFENDDLLAVELEVNSPLKIISLSQFKISIVDFINDTFEKDGIKKEVVNRIFGGFGD